MALTVPTVIPTQSLDPDQFNSELSQFMTWAATIPSQFNTLTFDAINDTSSSSVDTGSGNKVFTLTTGIPLVVGMNVMVWNSKSSWMMGSVKNYVAGTKTLTVTVLDSAGSGTFADWTITIHGLSAAPNFEPSSRVRVTTGNGCGSTNTMIRRFSVTAINIGSAITYADSATLGATFTINEDGWYGIDFQDSNTAEEYMGISVNADAEIAFSIFNVGQSFKIALDTMFITTSGISRGSCQALAYLSAGDVVRPHMSKNTGLDTSALTAFDIFKL